MTAEEQIATALVAKMAGTELMRVDSNTVVQPSTGPATKIDPRSFLPGHAQNTQQNERAILLEAQRLAEQLAPIPGNLAVLPPEVNGDHTRGIPVTKTSTQNQDPNQLVFGFLENENTSSLAKQLELVVDYLYSINSKLDTLTKHVKRTSSK